LSFVSTNPRFGPVRGGAVPGFWWGEKGREGRGGMLCGLRRLDPVKKAEEAGIPDATAIGGRREAFGNWNK